jgi:hypothetical protein
MVYATRSDRPMISTKPIKRTRKKHGRLEQIKEFLASRNSTFQDDASEEKTITEKAAGE